MTRTSKAPAGWRQVTVPRVRTETERPHTGKYRTRTRMWVVAEEEKCPLFLLDQLLEDFPVLETFFLVNIQW